MPHVFDAAVITAVLSHMNRDHRGDNLLIVRAFGRPDAVAAEMTGFDGHGGDWDVTSRGGAVVPARVPWPNGPITERAEVRREVVALYDAACSALGVLPRPH